MIEVLISTMYLENPIKLLKKMNINTDAVIINQCNYCKHEIINYNNHKITIISTTDRGLSKSRNLAIRNSTADILIFADDDFEYSKDYASVVAHAYEEYPSADIIVFGAIRNDNYIYKQFLNGKLNSRAKYNINSIRITAKRLTVLEKKLFFDERFGTGTDISCGEDTIFMSDCFKKKCLVFSNDFILCRGIKDDRESSWFHGYNEKFFLDRGLVYRRISKFSFFLSVYYIIKKYSLYKNDISPIVALKKMLFHH